MTHFLAARPSLNLAVVFFLLLQGLVHDLFIQLCLSQDLSIISTLNYTDDTRAIPCNIMHGHQCYRCYRHRRFPTVDSSGDAAKPRKAGPPRAAPARLRDLRGCLYEHVFTCTIWTCWAVVMFVGMRSTV